MFEFQSKFKRQIEILGLCLSERIQKPLRTFDLAGIFDVEELTIKRDLQDLRSYGIDIHSHKSEGITLDCRIPINKISEMILHYSSLNHDHFSQDKCTNLLVEKHGIKALANIVLLQRCIDNNETALVDYNKTGDRIEKGKPVDPVFLFQGDGSYRLIVLSGGKVKQLLLDKIMSVEPSGRRFKRGDYNINDLFRYAWKSWIGTERHCVKLWMSPFWAERVVPRMLAGDQVILTNEDGSIIFQCTVNSLNEIAGWIVSRGKGIKVIEPEELRQKVTELAEGVLANY